VLFVPIHPLPLSAFVAARALLWQQMKGCEVLSSPQMVRAFLRVRLGGLEHEVFAVLMLDAQHALIEYVELFRGTVSQTSVYPREVVKESLARNAAALILVHNPPVVCRRAVAGRRLTPLQMKRTRIGSWRDPRH
jgi:DNA repair protein RadC